MICLSVWLWWAWLRGSCLTEETGLVILGQGQPCGGDIEGVCGANLTCVTLEPYDVEDASGMGVCRSKSTFTILWLELLHRYMN